MKNKRFDLFLYLIVSTIMIFVGSCAFADLAERKITGYYYDPRSGKVLPKYDNLSPSEVDHYLGLKECSVQTSSYNSSNYNYADTSYINKAGQTLRDEYTYNYSDNEPQYQYSYSIQESETDDYYYYSNGNIQSYLGSGSFKEDYTYQGTNYNYDESYDWVENMLPNGYPSNGSDKYYDQNGKLAETDAYNYSYYDNGNYQSIDETGEGYDTSTGKKTYSYVYHDSYDINGNWTGYTYVYKDGDGNIIYSYTYP